MFQFFWPNVSGMFVGTNINNIYYYIIIPGKFKIEHLLLNLNIYGNLSIHRLAQISNKTIFCKMEKIHWQVALVVTLCLYIYGWYVNFITRSGYCMKSLLPCIFFLRTIWTHCSKRKALMFNTTHQTIELTFPQFSQSLSDYFWAGK